MHIRQLSFIALFSLVSSVSLAQGPIWSTKFANLGLAGKVFALLPAHDSLYVGGIFSSVAGVPANNIALWDGKRWNSLGSGTDKGVYSLAFDADGSVVVGGEFSQAGGQSANSIARWNRSSWSAIGSGVIPPAASQKTLRSGVLAILLTSAHELFIGGCFDKNGDGTKVNDVARWNGKAWDSLGSGFSPYDEPGNGMRDPGVVALRETNWGIAAAGYFIAAGNNLGSGVSFWNPDAWSAPLVDPSAQVNVSSVFYAGGSLVFAGDVSSKWPANPFVAYSGNGLFAGPLDFPGFPVSYVAGIGSTTFAAQSSPCDTCHVKNLAAFTGVWSPVGSGIDSTVTVMFSSGSRLYLAGNFTHANGQPSDGIAIYDVDPASVQVIARSPGSHSTSILTKTGTVLLSGSPKDISVFDAVGRAIRADCIVLSNRGEDQTEVNLSGLANGLYLITNGDQIIKVLLQR